MDAVFIISIGGEDTSTKCKLASSLRIRGRKLQDSTTVEFEIESRSSSKTDVGELRQSVFEAAEEGSIVNNVKAKAAEKGVLTPSLKVASIIFSR